MEVLLLLPLAIVIGLLLGVSIAWKTDNWFLGLLGFVIGVILVLLIPLVIYGVVAAINYARSTEIDRSNPPTIAGLCYARAADPNGLQIGHEPVYIPNGPAVISVWIPGTRRATQWVTLLPEGQSVTVTNPGQVWMYPKGCTNVAQSEMEKHINDLKRERPDLRVIRGDPPHF